MHEELEELDHPLGFGLSAVGFLVPAVLKPVTRGKPLGSGLLGVAARQLGLPVLFHGGAGGGRR